jgi:hypothetical protein
MDGGQAKVFIERIKPFSGTPFSVVADPAAEYKFINRIVELLQEGGWKWSSYAVSPISRPSGSADIPSSSHPLIAGVQVRFNGSRYYDFNGPANALSVALAEPLGASTSVVVDPAESPLAGSPDAILIEIRRKL